MANKKAAKKPAKKTKPATKPTKSKAKAKTKKTKTAAKTAKKKAAPKKQAPAKKATPASKKAPAKKAAPASKKAPAKKAAPASKKAPAKKAAPKKTAPMPEEVPLPSFEVTEVVEENVAEDPELEALFDEGGGTQRSWPPPMEAAPQPPTPAAEPSFLDPFKLVETSPGHFSLLLTVFDPASPVFEAAGHDAGGYAWAAVAEVLTSDRPELAGKFDLDPESSMFCAYGDSRAALEQLAQLLVAAWRDHGVLSRAIAAADWAEWD
jgi:hypothetical protein